MPVTRLSGLPNRPDLALVAGTGQLVAHLAHLVVGQTDEVTAVPMQCSAPVEGPVVNGEEQPCVQAAIFRSSARTTYAILNVCDSALSVDVAVSSPSALDTTTYHADDPGGWAPLPRNASELPWAGPLKPDTSHADVDASSTTLLLPPQSFSLHVFTPKSRRAERA